MFLVGLSPLRPQALLLLDAIDSLGTLLVKSPASIFFGALPCQYYQLTPASKCNNVLGSPPAHLLS